MQINKTPPNDYEAERGLLACLFSVPEYISKAEYEISPDDFYNSMNQKLYGSIIGYSKKYKLSHHSYSVYITSDHKLLEHLIRLDLTEFELYQVSEEQFRMYVSVVKNLSLRRKQIDLSIKIINDAYVDKVDPLANIEELRSYLEKAKSGEDIGIVEVSQISEEIDRLYEHGFQRGVLTGWPSLDQHYTVKLGEMTLVTGIPSHGKALAITTPIPTLEGFKTMGEIQIGDTVFDENGKPCNVINCTNIMFNRPCYEIQFSDGTKIICDESHQWFTRTDKARRSLYMAKRNGRLLVRELRPKGSDQTIKRTFPCIVTTKNIAETLFAEKGKRFNHCIEVAGAIELPEKTDLPIHPYALGVWLGDGHSDTATITCAYNDIQIINEIGYSMHEIKSSSLNSGLFRFGEKGKFHKKGKSIQSLLRQLGVLSNKHIPEKYLFASHNQKLLLLQGLMDTDGYITDYGRCEFTNMNKRLVDDVFVLICSLGMVPRIITGRATIYGKDCGEKYRITFTPHLPVFKLKRKSKYIKNFKRERLNYRRVVACKKVQSEPVKCIEVDSPSHLYLCSKAFILTHNSTFITNLIANIAKKDAWKFAIFSPENQPMSRYIAHISQIYTESPFSLKHKDCMTKGMLEYAKEWTNNHFVFLSPKDDELKFDSIMKKAVICCLKHGIKGLVLDPWNEVDHTRPPGLSETEYISKCLTKIRYFARTYKVHVWLIAHPTKLMKRQDGTYPIPTPYDISGSAHFRNKADCCLCVWRDLDLDSPRKYETDIYVQKIRFHEVGSIGKVTLTYNPLLQNYH